MRMTGVLALHEVMHETKRKRKTGLIQKLGFEKAYDKVDWAFLFNSMKQRGFNEVWCGWIKQVIISGVTISVKMNNQIGPYFVSHKRVRQGDPLAHILFNFVADCVTRMIKQTQRNGLVAGLASNLIDNGVAVL